MPVNPNPVDKDALGKKGRDLNRTVSENALDFDIATLGQGAIAAHINDPVGAHKASAISIEDAGEYYWTDQVEGVTQEIGQTLDETTAQGVVQGCTLTPTALTVELDPGSLVRTRGIEKDYTGQSVVLPNFSTRYVYIDTSTETLAEAAAPPGISAGVVLWKVTTNAGLVTLQEDMRFFVNNHDRKNIFTVDQSSAEANFRSLEAALLYLEEYHPISSIEKTTLLLRGEFTVSSIIPIPIDNVVLLGDGPNTTIRTGAVTSPVIFPDGKNGLQIKNIKFICDHSGSRAIYDVTGGGADNIIENCRFESGAGDWTQGIYYSSTTESERLVIRDCYIEANNGLIITRPHKARVQNVEAVATAGTGAGTIGISVGHTGATLNFNVAGNTIKDCQTTGFETGIYVKAMGTTVDNCVSTGCTLGANLAGGISVTYTNSTISLDPTTGEDGIYSACTDVRITNCLITNGRTSPWAAETPYGINLDNGVRAHITNCRINNFFNDNVNSGASIRVFVNEAHVSDCSLNYAFFGILKDDGEEFSCTSTSIKDVARGFQLQAGDLNTISGCTVVLSNATGQYGVASNVGDLRITDTIIDGTARIGGSWSGETPYGITLLDSACDNTHISNCEIIGMYNDTDDEGIGIQVTDLAITDVFITNTRIDQTKTGVFWGPAASGLKMDGVSISRVAEGMNCGGDNVLLNNCRIELDITRGVQAFSANGDNITLSNVRAYNPRTVWSGESPFGVIGTATDLSIRDCHFEGFVNTPDTLGAGVYLSAGAENVEISDTVFQSCYRGVRSITGTEIENLKVVNCTFDAITADSVLVEGTDGVSPGGNRIRVEGCTFQDAGDFSAVTLEYCRNFHINDNVINGNLGNTGWGIRSVGSNTWFGGRNRRFDISNNTIYATGGGCIRLEGFHEHGTINNNVLDNWIGNNTEPTADGIHLEVIPGTQATGTVTVTGSPLTNGDTITIDGVVLTGVAVPTSGQNEFDYNAGTTELIAQSIVDNINDTANDFTFVTAGRVGSVVTFTVVQPGTTGNTVTLSEASTGMTSSGSFSGGTNTDSTLQHIVISGNSVQRCEEGILLEGSRNDRIQNVSITGNTIHHCAHSAGGVDFRGVGAKAIGCYYVNGVTISGNMIDKTGKCLNDDLTEFNPANPDSSARGIYLLNCTKQVISNNTVRETVGQGSGGGIGIYSEIRSFVTGSFASEGVNITGNHVENDTRPAGGESIVVVAQDGNGGQNSQANMRDVNITGNTCRFTTYAPVAVTCGENSSIYGVNITGNSIAGWNEPNASGILVLAFSTTADMKDILVANNNVRGGDTGVGITVGPSDGTMKNVTISDNVVSDTGLAGILAQCAAGGTTGSPEMTNVKIDGNICEENGQTTGALTSYSIEVRAFNDNVGDMDNVIISNNIVKTPGFRCINVRYNDTFMDHVTIANNQVQGTVDYPAIQVETIRSVAENVAISDLTITGNNVDCGGKGITIESDGVMNRLNITNNVAYTSNTGRYSFHIEVDYNAPLVYSFETYCSNWVIDGNTFQAGFGTFIDYDGGGNKGGKLRSWTISNNNFHDSNTGDGLRIEVTNTDRTASPGSGYPPALYDLRVIGNTFHGCDNPGFVLDVPNSNNDVQNVTIANNTFWECSRANTVDRALVFIVNVAVSNILIDGNQISETGNGNNASDEGAIHLEVGDNMAHLTQIPGFPALREGVHNLVVSNNTVTQSGSTGLFIIEGGADVDWDSVTICGNSIQNTGSNGEGIRLDLEGTNTYVENLAVHGNTIQNCSEGIWVNIDDAGTDAQNISVTNNTISDTTGSAIQVWTPTDNGGDSLENLKINDNILYGIDGSGINLSINGSAYGIHVQNNVIDDGGIDGSTGIVLSATNEDGTALYGLNCSGNTIRWVTSGGTGCQLYLQARDVRQLTFSDNMIYGAISINLSVLLDANGTQKSCIFHHNSCRLATNAVLLTGSWTSPGGNGMICSQNVSSGDAAGTDDRWANLATGFDVTANNLDGVT